MDVHTSPRAQARLPERLSQCLVVVLWGFPEPSETFIQREMVHVRRLGGGVNVLAGHRVERADADPLLDQIAAEAMYLGPPAVWVARGLRYAVRRPSAFFGTLGWALRLPHRTAFHRVRMGVMVLAAAAAAERVRAAGYTYLHAHFAAYHTELVMALARLTGLPYGFTGHATGIWKDRNLLREKVGGARVVLTCTRHNADHLRRLAPEHAGKVHLVYHGLDFERLPEPAPLPPGATLRVLAVGRLVPKKGFTHLLDAVARLRRRGLDVHLTILGDGPERRRLEAQTARLGLADHVTMPGSVPNEAVWTALQASHALAMPSVRAKDGNLDGIPNVVLEAMAVARPVIGTRISGIPEVVLPGETGLLAEPGDAGALADALARLAADRKEAAAMGRRARAFVQEHFDVRANVARQLGLLEAAMAQEEVVHAG